MNTRVKICGITSIRDMELVAEAGADAIGLVFAKSPRLVSLEQAREIVEAAPPSLKTVGLFMDNPAEEIDSVLQELSLHLLQFHGRESAAECRRWGVPYIKALPMSQVDTEGATEGDTKAESVVEAAQNYPDAFAYLLDAHRPGQPGGTGAVFDWKLVPVDMPGQVILAGGLTQDNVGDAIRQVRPYAVDTSSGVESEPGIKDPQRVNGFIGQVRAVDGETD